MIHNIPDWFQIDEEACKALHELQDLDISLQFSLLFEMPGNKWTQPFEFLSHDFQDLRTYAKAYGDSVKFKNWRLTILVPNLHPLATSQWVSAYVDYGTDIATVVKESFFSFSLHKLEAIG